MERSTEYSRCRECDRTGTEKIHRKSKKDPFVIKIQQAAYLYLVVVVTVHVPYRRPWYVYSVVLLAVRNCIKSNADAVCQNSFLRVMHLYFAFNHGPHPKISTFQPTCNSQSMATTHKVSLRLACWSITRRKIQWGRSESIQFCRHSHIPLSRPARSPSGCINETRRERIQQCQRLYWLV